MDVLVAKMKNFQEQYYSMIERWGYTRGGREWSTSLGYIAKRGRSSISCIRLVHAGNEWFGSYSNARNQRNSKLPYIILVTSNAEKKDVVQGISAGANDYILKPYDRDELKERLERGRRAVEQQQALQQS